MKRSISRVFAAILCASSMISQAATQQEIDLALAPVKNNAQLQVILSDASALDALEDNLPLFLNSVTYTQQGAHDGIHFDQSVLEDNLTVTEIYKILALFGQQTNIAQYQGAEVVNDTDRLLLDISTSALPYCEAASPIDLSVIMDSSKQALFSYAQNNVACDGNVELTENTTITYQLVNTAESPQGLRLTGAGFANPFDAHIETVTVSEDGQAIYLQNNIQNTGVSKFQFIFASDENTLLLLSPDPQVINRPEN
ncbi:DP-EP family protein [Shewanella litoralis]|uniref:DP-EP family protein n=1 Tax=Shewanella litoralis TaxID=2282700 RepID=A0ABQ2RI20_9GAMM|nr:DP-EP family protein [Shewanella litoralis]GGQ27040.1 hypothetical protein GCM10009411_28610 [Shewanella litoralis]